MKNFINGYQNPKFKIIKPDGSVEQIYISFKYQGLTEYSEDSFIEHEIIDGSIEQIYKYTRLEFEIDFSQLIDKSDALKIQNILVHERNGSRIILYPNKDILQRSFEVVSVKNQRSLKLMHGGLIAPGHSGFVITFKTKYPAFENWLDPDAIPIMAFLYHNRAAIITIT